MQSHKAINHIVGFHYLSKKMSISYLFQNNFISLILDKNRKKRTLGESIPTEKRKSTLKFIYHYAEGFFLVLPFELSEACFPLTG